MRKVLTACFLLAFVLSCGSTRHTLQHEVPVQKPLEDPAAIAQAQERARTVLDSIDRSKAEKAAVSTQTKPEQKKTSVPPVPSCLADEVIAYARSFTGTPYKLGAPGPRQFDCSSFTAYVFRHFGYELTSYSQAQFREGREVSGYGDLKKGDLVFFGKRGSVRTIGHVGIVVSIEEESGSFTFIHASVSKGVTEDSSNSAYFLMRYMGARRILPD